MTQNQIKWIKIPFIIILSPFFIAGTIMAIIGWVVSSFVKWMLSDLSFKEALEYTRT
jgi:hypothetical protein